MSQCMQRRRHDCFERKPSATTPDCHSRTAAATAALHCGVCTPVVRPHHPPTRTLSSASSSAALLRLSLPGKLCAAQTDIRPDCPARRISALNLYRGGAPASSTPFGSLYTPYIHTLSRMYIQTDFLDLHGRLRLDTSEDYVCVRIEAASGTSLPRDSRQQWLPTMGSASARLLVPEVPPPPLNLPMPRRAPTVPTPGPRAAHRVSVSRGGSPGRGRPPISLPGGGVKLSVWDDPPPLLEIDPRGERRVRPPP